MSGIHASAPAALEPPRSMVKHWEVFDMAHDSASPENPEIPYGYCHCGCGQRTSIATETNRSKAAVKGEPSRYLPGHHACIKKPYSILEYVEEDRGFGSPCWIWQRQLNTDGYGKTSVNGRGYQAHRVVYERHRGPIPVGMQLDHLCRVRSCVNPDHLEPVTPRINGLRGTGFPAENARKTHCRHGHPFDKENTQWTKAGKRTCRECNRRRLSRRRMLRKEYEEVAA